jgi:hypothetical protein
MANLLAALGALKSILDGLRAIMRFVEENRQEAWFQESSKVFQRIRDAKTPEERKAVASDLAKLLGSLR